MRSKPSAFPWRSPPRHLPSPQAFRGRDTDEVDNMLLDKAIDARLKHQREEEYSREYDGDEPLPQSDIKCERYSNVVNCTNSTDPYCQDRG